MDEKPLPSFRELIVFAMIGVVPVLCGIPLLIWLVSKIFFWLISLWSGSGGQLA